MVPGGGEEKKRFSALRDSTDVDTLAPREFSNIGADIESLPGWGIFSHSSYMEQATFSASDCKVKKRFLNRSRALKSDSNSRDSGASELIRFRRSTCRSAFLWLSFSKANLIAREQLSSGFFRDSKYGRKIARWILIVRGILTPAESTTLLSILTMESSRFPHVYLQTIVGSTRVGTLSHRFSLTFSGRGQARRERISGPFRELP